MRSSGLASGFEDALRAYVRAAAQTLQAEVGEGAEVELELCAQRGRGGGRTPFFSYQPLTAEFIVERQPLLERLPEHAAAVGELCDFEGLNRYLARHGGASSDGREAAVPTGRGRAAYAADVHEGAHVRARRALQALLADVFAEQTDFELRAERLARALARLERTEPADANDSLTLLATLHGVAIASEEIKLTSGLTIATPAAIAAAPQAALETAEHSCECGHLLIALRCDDPGEPSEDAPSARAGDAEERALANGRAVLTDLLRALRLFGDGRVTLGPLAWTRGGGEGRWSAIALGLGGRPHGMLVIGPEQEDELRAFCNLVSRRAPHRNELAWALRRFELGCERASAYEGLSDHLLALRALLEPEGQASGKLAGRIAALCATPEDRAKLTERMTKAQALERAIVTGRATERASSLALAGDVADHLRALLRDVICGHLAADLAGLADRLLSDGVSSEASQRADPRELRGEIAGQGVLIEA